MPCGEAHDHEVSGLNLAVATLLSRSVLYDCVNIVVSEALSLCYFH